MTLGVSGIIAEVDRLERVVAEMRQPVTIRQVIAVVLLDFNERGIGSELIEAIIRSAAQEKAAWIRSQRADQVGEPG